MECPKLCSKISSLDKLLYFVVHLDLETKPHWWGYRATQAVPWYKVAKMAPLYVTAKVWMLQKYRGDTSFSGDKIQDDFLLHPYFLPLLKYCLSMLKTLCFFSGIHIFPQYLHAYYMLSHLFTQSFLRQGLAVYSKLTWNSVYIPGWPQNQDPSASAFQILGLQMTILNICF